MPIGLTAQGYSMSWSSFDVFFMYNMANLAQNGTKLGRMACPMCPGQYYTAKNICGPKVNHHVIVWPYFGCFLKCKIANLAQNGTKLGRVGRPQCVGPKILGRGWTHQLPQASLERNLDICGPFFDVWFTKVET